MKSNQSLNLELMEGRTFILGREGHIYIDSTTASKHHAEMRIVDGKIYLRDLGSTNGTFLRKNKALVRFEEGFVNPLQPIVIGGQSYVVQDLLKIANDFVVASSDTTQTLVEIVEETGQRRKA